MSEWNVEEIQRAIDIADLKLELEFMPEDRKLFRGLLKKYFTDKGLRQAIRQQLDYINEREYFIKEKLQEAK